MTASRSYKLSNVCLTTVQYRYEDNYITESMNLIKSGRYYQQYLETTMYFFNNKGLITCILNIGQL